MIDYEVHKIKGGVGRDFIRQHHYSHSCHNGPMCWGLFDGAELIGVCAFATPGSESVRASVWGPGTEDMVTELHRLFIIDGTPKNTESWFIARAIAGLRTDRPSIRGILSFADSTEGHVGTIYKATNALYCGTTGGRRKFWRDADGRLRHPRQNGHNVSQSEAEEMGWTAEVREAKHRYLYIIGTHSQRRQLRRDLILKQEEYPA